MLDKDRFAMLCPVCDEVLNNLKTVFSAEGTIYCSEECGIHDFKVDHGAAAEIAFRDCCEEVDTVSIGLRKKTVEEELGDFHISLDDLEVCGICGRLVAKEHISKGGACLICKEQLSR